MSGRETGRERTSLLIVRFTCGLSLTTAIEVPTVIEYHQDTCGFSSIQPSLSSRLPVKVATVQLYDLVPIRKSIVGACPLAVGTASSGAPLFRGLTGGVYKAQEHIHRSVADLRLLAIPTSRRRVAAFDLNWGVFFGIGSLSRVCVPLCTPL